MCWMMIYHSLLSIKKSLENFRRKLITMNGKSNELSGNKTMIDCGLERRKMNKQRNFIFSHRQKMKIKVNKNFVI